jgi:hypothetical protein
MFAVPWAPGEVKLMGLEGLMFEKRWFLSQVVCHYEVHDKNIISAAGVGGKDTAKPTISQICWPAVNMPTHSKHTSLNHIVVLAMICSHCWPKGPVAVFQVAGG